MKCKVLMKNNPQLLEMEFNKWLTDDIVIKNTLAHEWRGQIVWAIFHEGGPEEEAVAPLAPKPTVKREEYVNDMLCPFCNVLVRPGKVQRGRYKGRYQCPECTRTFTEEMVTNG